MSLIDHPKEADTTLLPNGQQKEYVVLSDEERKKGFVRPVRPTYRHVGATGPKYPLRDLTGEEHERYGTYYVKFEDYPKTESSGSMLGRFWSQEQLDRVAAGGCGTTTTMNTALAETYARRPSFYGGTFCCKCGTHLPVGEHGEFVWIEINGSDGPRVGT